MADELLDKIRDYVEGQIDFEGQRLADLLSIVLLIAVGVISFVTGYVTENIYNSLYVGLAGTGLALLIVVPPWPFYNQHPASWLPSQTIGGVSIEVDGKKVS